MLVPRASNRTVDPAFSSSRTKASKLSESAPGSVMEVENFFYSAFIGLERVAITRNGVGNAFQKTQGVVDILVTMERNKTAREEFRNRLAAGQARDYIILSMVEDK